MSKVIFNYSMHNFAQKRKSKFDRMLYGYTDKSKYGKYVYHRPGFLSDKSIEKLQPGCFVVDKKHQQEVESFFRAKKISFDIFLVG